MRDEDLNAPGGTDDLGEILHDIRERFVTTFAARCDAVAHLIERLADPGEDGSRSALLQIVHRMAGLAGTIGFVELGREANTLETLLYDAPTHGLDQRVAADLIARMRAAFERDLQQPAPEWEPPARTAPRANKILVVEDDTDQAKLLTSWLRHAGYGTKHVASGSAVLAVMAEEPPDLVLLDVGLPGMDGYTVCQRLKASPEFTRTPVIFLTTRASVDDRLLGLALGADDYVTKPADRHELLLRIRLRLKGRGSPTGGGGGTLSRKEPRAMLPFDAFTMVARAELERHAATLALVRAPTAAMPAVIRALNVSTRRGDAMAHIDRTHLVLLLPDMPLTAAHDRVRAILEPLIEAGATGIHAGVAATAGAGASFDTLLTDADEAFVTARHTGEVVATGAQVRGSEPVPPLNGTAVLMDGDLQVSPPIDRLMQGAGLRTIRTANGAHALDAVQRERPDVLLLDLMKPALRGFDVLQALGPQDTRPHIVVLAAREHEAEVTRAFELGADDYVTRPFSPQDLLVRVTRLMR